MTQTLLRKWERKVALDIWSGRMQALGSDFIYRNQLQIKLLDKCSIVFESTTQRKLLINNLKIMKIIFLIPVFNSNSIMWGKNIGLGIKANFILKCFTAMGSRGPTCHVPLKLNGHHKIDRGENLHSCRI